MPTKNRYVVGSNPTRGMVTETLSGVCCHPTKHERSGCARTTYALVSQWQRMPAQNRYVVGSSPTQGMIPIAPLVGAMGKDGWIARNR